MKIGFIGAGNMASAILGGILKENIISVEDLSVFDLNQEKCQFFAQKGLNIASDAKDVVRKSKYVFLAIKPQNIGDVLEEIKHQVSEDTVLVSIVAGVKSDWIQNQIGFACKVIRTMPNTPLMVGYGATALCCPENVSDEEFAVVDSIFSASGMTGVIDENKMNEIIAVHGSTPAFVYRFAKCITDHAKDMGIDSDLATKLFCQTLIGSAKMIIETSYSVDELIKMVSSPGGTTLEGLKAMDRQGFDEAVYQAMDDCVRRAYELSE